MAAASPWRRARRGGQARVRRPQAARHPQYGRARDGADRAARRDLPHRARLSADDARRRRGREGLEPRAARRLRAHLERRRRPRRGGLRLRRGELVERRARQAVAAAIDGLVCSPAEAATDSRRGRRRRFCWSRRASARPARRPATRSASPRPRRRSATAPTISWSAGRSRKAPTRAPPPSGSSRRSRRRLDRRPIDSNRRCGKADGSFPSRPCFERYPMPSVLIETRRAYSPRRRSR